MIFTAFLKRHSTVYQEWIGKSRVAGDLCGVHFHRTVAGDFVAETIPDDKLGQLMANSAVQLVQSMLKPAIDGELVPEEALEQVKVKRLKK